MKIRRGMAALMTACLAASVVTAAAPSISGSLSALAATTVVSPGVVPVGGTSAAAASFTVQENWPGAWKAGGTISIAISDAQGADTLTFTNAAGGAPAPTLSAPLALGASIAGVAANSFTVAITSDDGVNALAFTVSNLYITAASDAARGPISATTSGTIDASTYGPVNFVSSVTNAVGLLAQSYPAGATSMAVLIRSSCGFAAVGTQTTQSGIAYVAGHFIIGGYDAGPTGTVSALGAPSSDEELLSGFSPLPAAVPVGALVTQANVPDCPSTLPALIAVTVSVSPTTIAAGGTVTYTYTVTNPGVAPLASVTVTDTACAPVRYVSGDTDGDGILQAGETWIYTCSATPGATITDGASASGTANGRISVANAQTTVTVPSAPPPPPATLTPVALTEGIAPGVDRGVAGFSTSSVVVPRDAYVTVLATTRPNLAGDVIQIWTRGKATDWRPATVRRVAADGTVHYYARVSGWTAYRMKFLGDATHAVATSHGRIATNPT